MPPTLHCETPVAQLVRPVWHGLLISVHGWLGVQVAQVPLWQNMFVPQPLPSAANWQAPAPLHVVIWQLASVVPQAGSATPSPLLLQVPGVARLQAMQRPQVAVPQQTPSTQLPEVHSRPAAQTEPLGLLVTHRAAIQ